MTDFVKKLLYVNQKLDEIRAEQNRLNDEQEALLREVSAIRDEIKTLDDPKSKADEYTPIVQKIMDKCTSNVIRLEALRAEADTLMASTFGK